MDQAMKHRGFHAEISLEDGMFVGHIAGIRDRVGFHAESREAFQRAFEEAVDDYLLTCQTIGKAPEKPL
jgi:predicted HicB family RNase H-like nuclease